MYLTSRPLDSPDIRARSQITTTIPEIPTALVAVATGTGSSQNPGVIVGSVIGGVLLAAILCMVLVMLLLRTKRQTLSLASFVESKMGTRQAADQVSDEERQASPPITLCTPSGHSSGHANDSLSSDHDNLPLVPPRAPDPAAKSSRIVTKTLDRRISILTFTSGLEVDSLINGHSYMGSGATGKKVPTESPPESGTFSHRSSHPPFLMPHATATTSYLIGKDEGRNWLDRAPPRSLFLSQLPMARISLEACERRTPSNVQRKLTAQYILRRDSRRPIEH